MSGRKIEEIGRSTRGRYIRNIADINELDEMFVALRYPYQYSVI